MSECGISRTQKEDTTHYHHHGSHDDKFLEISQLQESRGLVVEARLKPVAPQ